MLYSDYDFYIGEYHGSTVSNADFTRLAIPADAYINHITFDRAATIVGADSKLERRIKLAECAAIEALFGAESRAGISSESVGKHSVTYTQSNAQHDAVQAARPYLSGTGLMYPGV